MKGKSRVRKKSKECSLSGRVCECCPNNWNQATTSPSSLLRRVANKRFRLVLLPLQIETLPRFCILLPWSICPNPLPCSSKKNSSKWWKVQIDPEQSPSWENNVHKISVFRRHALHHQLPTSVFDFFPELRFVAEKQRSKGYFAEVVLQSSTQLRLE